MLSCPICSKEMISFKLLKRHIKICHLDCFQGKLVECNQNGCKRTYNNIYNLYSHIRRTHTELVSTSSTTIETETTAIEQEDITPMYTRDTIEIGIAGCHNTSKFTKNQELNYLFGLYEKPHLSRKDVNDVVQETKNLVENLFENEGLVLSEHFKDLETENLRIKYFQENGFYVPPKTVTIGTSSAGDHKIQYVSITETLRAIFSAPEVLEQARTYMSFKSINICDYKDAKRYNANSSVPFPFVIFYDDFETGNSLGSKKGKHKLGAIYMSLRCGPVKEYSKLSNIYLVSLFPSKLRETLGNARLFNPLVTEITDLEQNGIHFGNDRIDFVLAGMLGDNLGIHSILGFNESFVSRFGCRFCRVSRSTAQVMTREDRSLLRNAQNYETDLALADAASSGIKEPCCFNRIPSFHVTSNYFVDVMHDLCEGVCNYDLVHIFQYYIDKQVFSLETLNCRIQAFPFSSVNKTNKPPIIKSNKLKNKDLSLSAAEMHNLVSYLNLIIGDLIPLQCEVWNFFLILQCILCICSCKSITPPTCNYLDVLVAEHHELYIQLFKQTLKPKFHFMLHYGRIILESGPLAHNWGYRFEGKHFQLKQYTNVCRSRMNLTKSVVVRHQLGLCGRFWRENSDQLGTSKGTVCDDGYYRCKNITNSGGKISVADTVFLKIDHDLPVFGKIHNIFVKDDVKIQFQMYKTAGYDSHLNAYEIEETEDPVLNIVFDREIRFDPLIVVELKSLKYTMYNSFQC